jgi:lipid II:glycine glycyltransferase (peptidoglycan interpeptide bridge formation enzyme)
MEDLRQSQEYSGYMKSLGWIIDSGVFIKKIPLVPFYFAKWQRPEKVNIQTVNKLKNKYKKLLMKIEPLEQDRQVEERLRRWGFKKDKVPMLPSKTLIIDLETSLNKLLKEMQGKARYNLKRYRDKNLKIKILSGDQITEKELESFYQVYKNNYRRQKFWGLKYWQIKSLVKSFGKKAYLLKAKEAGLLILVHEKIAYYSHNASSGKGRRECVPSLLIFEAVLLAKKLKLKTFDFEGVQDKRYKITKKWKGFTRFKKSFGGKEKIFLGSFSKFFFKI